MKFILYLVLVLVIAFAIFIYLANRALSTPPIKNIPPSDHFDGKKFFNPHVDTKNRFSKFLKWRLSQSERTPWPKWVENNHSPQLPASLKHSDISVTLINHSTVLIQTPSLNILTDPIYSNRASPVNFLGPKRVRAPSIPFEKLPPIDVVIISHNHYDHMDMPTLRKLQASHNPLFITGLGNKALLSKYKINNVIELDWFQTYTNDKAIFTFTPAQHFSARTPFDRDNSLWGGFSIKINDKNIFFAGDTGYGPHFKEIAEKLGTFDLALLPIGCYLPRWFMKPMHLNPPEAVQAHLDLNSKVAIPIHYASFQLTDEAIDQPLIDLETALQESKVQNFKVLEFGENFLID